MNMKKTALLISLLLLASAAASCGDQAKPNTPAVSGDNTPVAETEAVTAASEDRLASIGKLSELDFGGQTLTIDISVDETEWNTSAVYVMGADEEVGEEVKDMVYRRNRDIADALNVKIDWITTELNWPDVQAHVQTPIMAGDGTVQLYINDQLGLVNAMLKGSFINVLGMDEEINHFDFTSDGWRNEYMDNLSIIDGKRYLLVGDYFMDSFRGVHTLYFNKNLMDSYFEGSDELYTMVEDGKWTYEKYVGYAKDFYRDLNGDGKADLEDLYGVRADYRWARLYYCVTDCRSVSWDKDGMPYLDPSIERISKLTDYLIDLFSSPGYHDIESSQITKKFFSEGKVLFTTWQKIADMEAPEMRNMDGIGLIPYPKLDEAQNNYYTFVHNIAEIGAIPVTITEKQFEAMSAYIQAMTQYTAKYIMPAYYETALKIKYSQDEQSARMLDIIRDGIRNPFENAFSDFVANEGSNLVRDALEKRVNNIASAAEKNRKLADKNLGKLLESLSELE